VAKEAGPMKERTGFVSNSSASSFVLLKDGLTWRQCERMMHHAHDPRCPDGEAWDVKDMGDRVRFSTSLDNFNLRAYAEEVGIPDGNVVEHERG